MANVINNGLYLLSKLSDQEVATTMKRKPTTKPLTAKQIQDQLHGDGVSKHKGVFTARRGFFYTHGGTEQQLVNDIKSTFPDAKIIDSGEVYKPFKGGASLRSQSHWWVAFTL